MSHHITCTCGIGCLHGHNCLVNKNTYVSGQDVVAAQQQRTQQVQLWAGGAGGKLDGHEPQPAMENHRVAPDKPVQL